VELLGTHREIAGGGREIETFSGRHHTPDGNEECEGEEGSQCTCDVVRGAGADRFASEWFDGKCSTFIIPGAPDKMNHVPIISYRREGPWTIALLSGVVYT
jgi:hypothetical protein